MPTVPAMDVRLLAIRQTLEFSRRVFPMAYILPPCVHPVGMRKQYHILMYLRPYRGACAVQSKTINNYFARLRADKPV